MQLVEYLIETVKKEEPDLDESTTIRIIQRELTDAVSETIREMDLPPVPGKVQREIADKRFSRMREGLRPKAEAEFDQHSRFLSSLWNLQTKLDGFGPANGARMISESATTITIPRYRPRAPSDALPMPMPKQGTLALPSIAYRGISLTDLTSPELRKRLQDVLLGMASGPAEPTFLVDSDAQKLIRRDSIFREYVKFLKSFFEDTLYVVPGIKQGELTVWRDPEEPDWETLKLRITMAPGPFDRTLEAWKQLDEHFQRKTHDFLLNLPRPVTRRYKRFIENTYIDLLPKT